MRIIRTIRVVSGKVIFFILRLLTFSLKVLLTFPLKCNFYYDHIEKLFCKYPVKLNQIHCSPKDMYKQVHSRLIHNSHKPKTTQTSTNAMMNKYTVIYSNTGTLDSNEKRMNCYMQQHGWIAQIRYWAKEAWLEHILHDSFCMKFRSEQN